MNSNLLKAAILLHLQNGTLPDEVLLNELKNYKGEDDVLLGAQAYLLDHGFEQLIQLNFQLPEFKTRARKKRGVLAAAASLVILVFALWLWNNWQDNHFKVIEEGTAVFMGDYQNDLNDFMNAYRTGEYEQVIELGKQRLKIRPSDTLYFYSACANNYRGDYEQALADFSKVNQTSAFFHAALYQRAFANYQLGRSDSARVLLQTLMNTNSPHSEKASKFLQAIQ